MRYIIILIQLIITFNAYSQNVSGITFGVSKGVIDLKERKGNHSTTFDNYKINITTQFFNRLNTGVEIGFINMNRRKYNSLYISNFKSVKLGLDLDYRFLKNSIVSPKIGVGGGVFPYSNMKGKHVFYNNGGSDLAIDPKNKTINIFSSWRSYADAQVYLSIKLTNFYIDLGGGFSYMRFNFKDNDSHNLFGPQISFKLSYVFPFNKKKLNNKNQQS